MTSSEGHILPKLPEKDSYFGAIMSRFVSSNQPELRK
jgi:hypothetical protein